MNPVNKGQAIAARMPVGPGVRALNPALFGGAAPAETKPKKNATGMGKPRNAPTMNKTETAYSLILEAMKRRGDITDWEREGITLRWKDGMKYTPDFTVTSGTVGIVRVGETLPRECVALTFIEVKGPKIEEDALVKFRSARDKWSRYRFEMWQLKAHAWTKVL